jgi:hypothetical protein
MRSDTSESNPQESDLIYLPSLQLREALSIVDRTVSVGADLRSYKHFCKIQNKNENLILKKLVLFFR